MVSSAAPTRLYVTGIAWIVIALINLQLALTLAVMMLTPGADSFGIALFSAAVALVGLVGALGLAGGIGLLLRKPWARATLEVLTWGCCGICVAAGGFGVYLLLTWPDPSTRYVPIISIVGYPSMLVGLVPLLWAVRSRSMRDAVRVAAQQAHPADGTDVVG
jgi:hypothetical protein